MQFGPETPERRVTLSRTRPLGSTPGGILKAPAVTGPKKSMSKGEAFFVQADLVNDWRIITGPIKALINDKGRRSVTSRGKRKRQGGV